MLSCPDSKSGTPVYLDSLNYPVLGIQGFFQMQMGLFLSLVTTYHSQSS